MTTTMMKPPTNGVPARRYEPLAPVGGGLKALIETQRDGLAAMLPKHITPERLLKTLLVAANRNPDILKCTQASVIETINRAAELGLDLSGTLGEAYPVPFNNKVKTGNGEQWVTQLQLIIGYRGLEKLAWQSGEVESIDAEVVYSKDRFEFSKGTEVKVEWAPHLGDDRGEVVGAYACLKLKSGGKLARFLTRGDIEKIRNASKSANSPAWKNWWGEMARKCALKRMLKDAPLSTEKFVRAMDHDGEDIDLSNVLAAETGPSRSKSATDALNASITRRPVDDRHTIEVDEDAATNVAAQDAAEGEPTIIEGEEVPADDVDHQQPEAPAGDVSTWESTCAEIDNFLEQHRDIEAGVKAAVNLWCLANGSKDKQDKKTTPAQRAELLAAIKAGKLGADGKIAK